MGDQKPRLTDGGVLQVCRRPSVRRQVDGALAVGVVRHVFLVAGADAFAGVLAGSRTQATHSLQPEDLARAADDVVDRGRRAQRRRPD